MIMMLIMMTASIFVEVDDDGNDGDGDIHSTTAAER